MSRKHKTRAAQPSDPEAITGKTLIAQGWQEGRVLGLAIAVAQQLQSGGAPRAAAMALLEQVRRSPADYLADPAAGELARALLKPARSSETSQVLSAELRAEPLPG